jgi:hypothetical protein
MSRVVITSRFAYEKTDPPANVWTIVHKLNITSPVVRVWATSNVDGQYTLLTVGTDYNMHVPNASTVTITFTNNALVKGNALVT